MKQAHTIRLAISSSSAQPVRSTQRRRVTARQQEIASPALWSTALRLAGACWPAGSRLQVPSSTRGQPRPSEAAGGGGGTSAAAGLSGAVGAGGWTASRLRPPGACARPLPLGTPGSNQAGQGRQAAVRPPPCLPGRGQDAAVRRPVQLPSRAPPTCRRLHLGLAAPPPPALPPASLQPAREEAIGRLQYGQAAIGGRADSRRAGGATRVRRPIKLAAHLPVATPPPASHPAPATSPRRQHTPPRSHHVCPHPVPGLRPLPPRWLRQRWLLRRRHRLFWCAREPGVVGGLPPPPSQVQPDGSRRPPPLAGRQP